MTTSLSYVPDEYLDHPTVVAQAPWLTRGRTTTEPNTKRRQPDGEVPTNPTQYQRTEPSSNGTRKATASRTVATPQQQPGPEQPQQALQRAATASPAAYRDSEEAAEALEKINAYNKIPTLRRAMKKADENEELTSDMRLDFKREINAVSLPLMQEHNRARLNDPARALLHRQHFSDEHEWEGEWIATMTKRMPPLCPRLNRVHGNKVVCSHGKPLGARGQCACEQAEAASYHQQQHDAYRTVLYQTIPMDAAPYDPAEEAQKHAAEVERRLVKEHRLLRARINRDAWW